MIRPDTSDAPQPPATLPYLGSMKQRIDVYHHLVMPGDRTDEILQAIRALSGKADTMANELDDLTAKVEENSSVDESAIVLLNGLKDALDAAGTDKAKLKALSEQLGSSSSDLAAAVAKNTPGATGGEGTGGADPTTTPDPFPSGSGISPAPDATNAEASLRGVVPGPEQTLPGQAQVGQNSETNIAPDDRDAAKDADIDNPVVEQQDGGDAADEPGPVDKTGSK